MLYQSLATDRKCSIETLKKESHKLHLHVAFTKTDNEVSKKITHFLLSSSQAREIYTCPPSPEDMMEDEQLSRNEELVPFSQ